MVDFHSCSIELVLTVAMVMDESKLKKKKKNFINRNSFSGF